MGRKKTEKPKVTFILTPGYEQRFTMAILDAYAKSERRKKEARLAAESAEQAIERGVLDEKNIIS